MIGYLEINENKFCSNLNCNPVIDIIQDKTDFAE
jgi:hypothetical protein